MFSRCLIHARLQLISCQRNPSSLGDLIINGLRILLVCAPANWLTLLLQNAAPRRVPGCKMQIDYCFTWNFRHNPCVTENMMNAIIENLFALQQLESQQKADGTGAARELSMGKLRQAIPTKILSHFDRMRARNKKGVAMVRQGVCTECHMRLPIGTLVDLLHEEEVRRCDNCGRYLYLP